MFEGSVQPVNFIVSAAVIGMGATAFMDVWALFLKMVANISGLDYAMVGRWIGHMPSGKITHENIGSSPAIHGESAIGWIAHYTTGGLFAAALLAIVGLSLGWLSHVAACIGHGVDHRRVSMVAHAALLWNGGCCQ